MILLEYEVLSFCCLKLKISFLSKLHIGPVIVLGYLFLDLSFGMVFGYFILDLRLVMVFAILDIRLVMVLAVLFWI